MIQIEMRVAQALSMPGNWPKPYKPSSPVTFKVELATPDRTNDFKGRAGDFYCDDLLLRELPFLAQAPSALANGLFHGQQLKRT